MNECYCICSVSFIDKVIIYENYVNGYFMATSIYDLG